MKYTPGPWEVYGRGIYQTEKAGGREVVHGNGIKGRDDKDEAEANAILIALAPDLLKELISMLDELCRTCRLLNPQHANCNSCEGTEKARVLIAKAEGTL
jgi:hypothetical protein